MNSNPGSTVEKVDGGWIINLPGDEPSPLVQTKLEAVAYVHECFRKKQIDLYVAIDASRQIARSKMPGPMPSHIGTEQKILRLLPILNKPKPASLN